jgi:hypothetical protein
METRVTLSEAAVMLLIYDHEYERNEAKRVQLSRELAILRDRQDRLHKMIATVKESIKA